MATAKNRALKLRQTFEQTQEQFARMLKVSFTTVSRWENGHTMPTGVGGAILDLLDKARDRCEDELIMDELRECKDQAEVIGKLAILGQ